MATLEDVRALGTELDRSYEAVVRGRLKFRVGSLVYVAFSADERTIELAFPKQEREAVVASDPRFRLPTESEMRFHWIHADLGALEAAEARELVVDAWTMVVPMKLVRAYELAHPDGPGPPRS